MPRFYLFVYGTLRSGYRNRYARLLAKSSDFAGPARVRGRLYRVEHYTGIKLQTEPAEWVRGEVYRLHDPRRILSVLDSYEGSEFQRVIAAVVLSSGRRLHCWIYEYRG